MAHENVIRVVDLIPPPRGASFSDIYIAMEFMETDLRSVIYSRQPLSIDHFQYFMYQILRGLKYLHSARIIHRNLTPSSIFVNENCDLKIGNFCKARVVYCDLDEDANEKEPHTEAVTLPWYSSPEMLLASNYSFPVDLWAAGCIFAEMLNRSPMFQGDDNVQTIKLVVKKLSLARDDNSLDFITSKKALKFIHSLPDESTPSMTELFPQHSNETDALHLLRGLLEIIPSKRYTLDSAMQHPFLASLHNPSDEPTANFEPPLESLNELMTEEMVRERLWQEIRSFHPEIATTFPREVSEPPSNHREGRGSRGIAFFVGSPSDVPKSLVAFGEEDDTIGR